MNDPLFERYCRGKLTEPEKRRLARRLENPATSRKFAAFVLEWDLLGAAALQRAAAVRQGPRAAP